MNVINETWSQIAANAICHAAVMAGQEIAQSMQAHTRPCVVFRPKLTAEGEHWCFLLGEDLQTGVAGFGDTVEAAAHAFDMAFWKQRTPAAMISERAKKGGAA